MFLLWSFVRFMVFIVFCCFFQCFCFGSGLGGLERFGELWDALGDSGMLWEALGGSGKLCEALGSPGRLC